VLTAAIVASQQEFEQLTSAVKMSTHTPDVQQLTLIHAIAAAALQAPAPYMASFWL
jgi:hypothetical protein